MELQEVVERCWKDKREIDKASPLTYYFYRPVSFPITKFALEKGISANSVTWFSLFILALAVPFLLGGNIALKVTGVLFLVFWAILDTVDGNIARYNNAFTDYGHFIDTLVGYAAYVVIFFVPGLLVDTGALISPYTALFLSGASSAAFLFARLIHQKYTNIFDDLSQKTIHVGDVKNKTGLFKKLYSNIVTFEGFLPLVLLISILAGFVELFVIFYFLANIATAVLYTVSTVKKATTR